VRGYYALPLLWRDQVIGWGKAAYRRALDEELQRLREFLALG
jgi:uncharacterized protein YcaQ